MANSVNRSDGTQIDYEEFLEYKGSFNSERTLNYSSTELYEERKRRDTDRTISALMTAGATVTGVGAVGYFTSRSQLGTDLLSSLPGADLLGDRLNRSFKAGNIEPFVPNPSLSRSVQSMLMGLEELTPMHLMKTLQLSSFTSILVDTIEEQAAIRHISTQSIRTYNEYYRNLILNSSGYSLTEQDIKNGLILKNGKLYQAMADGTTGRELLGHAKVVHTNIAIGSQDSPNRVFQKFANIQGVKQTYIDQFKNEPLIVVGGKDQRTTFGNWIRAYGRFSAEIGYKVLDNPLGFIEEIAKASGGEDSKIINSKVYQTLKKYTNIQLGTGGAYNLSTRESVKLMAKNIAVKSSALYIGYNAINSVLDNITSENSVWHDGLAAGLATTLQNAHIGFASIWSDRFQGYRQQQEEAAPNSTNLATLIGLPLAGAMTGANIAYFHRMKDTTVKGLTSAADKHSSERALGGKLGELLSEKGVKIKGTTLRRYSAVGALAGTALTIPFLPGALIGRSSEELREEYSGSKDVAVKRNRYWIFGGTPFEGEGIKYFRKNLVTEGAKDAKNKSLYRDSDQKRAMDPIFSPFRYLRDPYAFEAAHVDSMPYPVWGMDVTYGSFLGKAFQSTIGEVIKPTIVNPDMDALVEKSHGKTSMILKSLNYVMGRSKGEGSSSSVHSTASVAGGAPIAQVEADESRQGVGGVYNYRVDEKKEVKSLIADGMMYPQSAAIVPTTGTNMAGLYSAASDFQGLKGFTSSLVLDGMNISPDKQVVPELARSGSAITAKDTYQEMQLGDALGCFVPGMEVLTSEGYKEIQYITEDDYVLSKNNTYQKVREVFVKEFKNIQILKVYLEDREEPIVCTPDHVFPSSRYQSKFIEDSEICTLDINDSLEVVITNIFGELDKILVPIIGIEVTDYTGLMYDLGVENTPYYTVNNVVCHNSGEFVRRLIPQSAGTNRETVNPLRNNVAPSWLPQNETKYTRDFGKGDYFNIVDRGETLLPSLGFNELNPALKGKNPEDYPLVYQYKILQNVARNSPEHLALRDHLRDNLDSLTDDEKKVFFEAYGQEKDRGQEKKFYEYKDGKGLANPIQVAQNVLWESFSHKESPLEPLTPFRPMSKFIHQRTATEDYLRTQIYGPDTAIWTKPIDHFIKPAFNRSMGVFNSDFKPQSVKEKENIDEFFDKIRFLKALRAEDLPESRRTLTQLTYSGVRDADDMKAFRSALPKEQRAYMEAFAREKSGEKRKEILSLVPKDVGRVYTSIWENIDIYDEAKAKGKDPRKALEENYNKKTKILAKTLDLSLSKSDKQRIEYNRSKASSREQKRKAEERTQGEIIRRKAAEKEAVDYVQTRLGGKLPKDDWVGWDPRISSDQIKLKTLLIGREDIYRFGYWKKDADTVERIKALDEDNRVVADLNIIRKEMKDLRNKQESLRNKLKRQGFEVYRTSAIPSTQEAVTFKNKEEYQ